MKLTYIYMMFIVAFTAANLIVKNTGPYGFWITSFLLIPFDFIARCIIHERLRGLELICTMFGLTLAAGIITVLINFHALNIAAGSVCAFTAAQLFAGIFYQLNIKSKNLFMKVNVSDLIAISVDSFVFQLVAFQIFDWKITLGQTAIKFLGGLIWYFILFKKLKLHKRYVNTN